MDYGGSWGVGGVGGVVGVGWEMLRCLYGMKWDTSFQGVCGPTIGSQALSGSRDRVRVETGTKRAAPPQHKNAVATA